LDEVVSVYGPSTIGLIDKEQKTDKAQNNHFEGF
jgi:hypothetical protein